MTSQTVTQRNAWPAILVGLLAVSMLTGTVSYAGQERLAAKMAETSTEVIRTRDQLQATMSALSALVRQKKGDLKPAYDTYAAEVAKTQSAAEWTRQTGLTMKEQSAAYFNEWEKDLNGVSNPKLRAKAQKRMTKVQKNYDNAAAALDDAGAKFAPFLSDLADIQKVLANDLTEGGLKSLRRTVSSAEFNQGTVRRAINAAASELDKVAASLKPDTK